MLSKPFAVSIRAALPLLLVFAFFFCPLVVWSVRGAGASGVLTAVNRILVGTGLSVTTGTGDDTPASRVFAVRIEPASVQTREGATVAVRHLLEVFGPDDWCTGPWATGSEKWAGIGGMLGISIDPPQLPSCGLVVRCNGVVQALNFTDEGPVLGPVPASMPPPIEQVSLSFTEPSGNAKPLWSRGTVKWFNDDGANRLINTPGLTLKKGYVNKSVAVEPPGTGVYFVADVADDGIPVAGVTLAPVEGASPWKYLAVALATQPGAPPLVILTVPEPVHPGWPPPGPCVLDLLLDENGNGGSVGLTLLDRDTEWEVWWSPDSVEIVPAT